jgi:hypothetical protein
LHARVTSQVKIEIRNNNQKNKKTMTETVGTLAGAVWTALNENGALNLKDLKKVAKIKTDKDLYLALGWLLREDKVVVAEADKVVTVTLK